MDPRPDLPASLDWTTRLCRIDSTSRDTNRPLVELVAGELRRLGVQPHLFDSPDGLKQGLVATIPAADGTTTGGVVLSGHSDVVPVDGQHWSSDPFEPEVRDGRLYARGAADMKGYLGAVVHLLPELVDTPLREPVHVALSYDEELGCRGGDDIVAQVNALGLSPRGALVGEPTSMRVVRAHKSVNMVTATFTGVAAHSSLTADGVNAVEYAAELVCWWRRVTEGWKNDGPFDHGYPLAWSTGGANQFSGGTAVNIVPASAVVVLEFRTLAQVDAQQVVDDIRSVCEDLARRMQAEDPAAGVELAVDAMVPGLDTPADAWVAELAHAAGGIRCDEKVTYGTEAGQFARGSIPAVVCGPGDIAQAHKADEFVALEQLQACEDYLRELLAGLRLPG